MALWLVPRPFPRFAQRATGAQAGHQLTLERAASLDVERLVDRLVADAHVDIVGEVEDQPPGDLLWTPGRGPAPIGAVRLVQPLPGRWRASRDGPIRTLQLPAQPGLDVVLKPWIARQFRRLGTPRRGLRLPLRDTRPVVGLAAAGRGVAPQLARDRPGIALELPGDRTDALALRLQQRDLLTLGERQIAAGGLGQAQRRHAASVTKPAHRDGRRHADLQRRLLGALALRNQPPEGALHMPRRHRPARRAHRRSQSPIRLLLTSCHRTPL